MATFKPVIRANKEYNAVYIRISHNSGTDYIKTDMILHKSGIKKGEIADYTILANCAIKIKSYVDKINQTNIGDWTVQELKKYLTDELKQISFTDFSMKYIDEMRVNGRKKPAANYNTALNSLKKYYKKENIFFSDITSREIRKWIESLSGTARAKQLYPAIIKKLFNEGCLEHNDYDRNIIKIPNQPFKAVIIPDSEVPKKRSVDVETIRKILEVKPELPRERLANDVSILVLYLAGINTVDLYNIGKEEFKGGKLCYNRTKTKNKRKDKAYLEITARDEILPLLEKYKGKLRLFDFKEKYSDSDIFLTAVNKGLKSLCKKAGVQKITVYWLRHTWATTAQNKCGASTELVAFCLNHTSAHRVTEGYIEKDFSPIDELNKKVLDYIFLENRL
jgi:integrase